MGCHHWAQLRGKGPPWQARGADPPLGTPRGLLKGGSPYIPTPPAPNEALLR